MIMNQLQIDISTRLKNTFIWVSDLIRFVLYCTEYTIIDNWFFYTRIFRVIPSYFLTQILNNRYLAHDSQIEHIWDVVSVSNIINWSSLQQIADIAMPMHCRYFCTLFNLFVQSGQCDTKARHSILITRLPTVGSLPSS